MTLIATKVSNALSLQPHHFYHSSIIFSFGAQRPIYIFLSETSFRSMNVGGEANYGHNPTGFITGQFAFSACVGVRVNGIFASFYLTQGLNQ